MTDRLRLSEHNRRWWTLGAMSFALFMVMLDNTAVNVALPSIQEDFADSLSDDEQKKLEAALDALLQRPEVAEIYSNMERKLRR